MTIKPTNTHIAGILIFLFSLWGFLVSPSITQETKELTKNWVSPSTGIEFLHISAGCFRMGTENGFDFESPVHDVCVNEFYLGKFEVTQEQWDKFMPDNLSKFSEKSRPAERVSWNDAKIFIKKLNKAKKHRKVSPS